MKKIPILLSLLLVLLMGGCQKVVEFDVDDIDTHVVLNGVPSVDSTMFVNVSYSRFFLDNTQYLAATGADVTLWVNGSPLSGSYRDGGNYFFPYTVTAGDSLRIQVQLDGREPLSAATRVPDMPVVDSLTAECDTNQLLPTIAIRCRLHDPAGANYYRFFVVERDSGEYFSSRTHKVEHIDTMGAIYFSCADPDLIDDEATSSEALLGTFFGELMSKDVHFDGQTHTLEFSVMNVPDTSERPGYRRWYWLYVESLSPDYYNYRISVSQANSMTSYFAEPSKIYSNVANGLGIFAGKARRKLPLTITYVQGDTQSTKVSRASRSTRVPKFAPLKK